MSDMATRKSTDPNRHALEALARHKASKRQQLEAEFAASRDLLVGLIASDPVRFCEIVEQILPQSKWEAKLGFEPGRQPIAVKILVRQFGANRTFGFCADGTLRCLQNLVFDSCDMHAERSRRRCKALYHVVPVSDLSEEILRDTVEDIDEILVRHGVKSEHTL